MLEGNSLLAAYAVTSIIAAITPGPAVLYIVGTALSGSRRALAGAIVGMNCTNALWYVLVGSGLIAVFNLFPSLFMAMRVAGIAYLVWLGMMTWRHPAHMGPAEKHRTKGFWTSFWGGFAMQASNPKALLYFTVFLPPFIDMSRPATMQLVHLAIIGISLEIIILIGYGMLADNIGRRDLSPRTRTRIARISGAMLLAIAGAMASTLFS